MDEPGGSKAYFVDEAGDSTIFDGRGRIIAGTEGCSRYFVLGVLSVANPGLLNQRLGRLHAEILADPFFEGVESFKSERRKTAKLLHAKDDIPEVRERVFRLLADQDIHFFAVIRDKLGLAVDVRNRNKQSQSYRYHPNRLYDEMVKRLFKNLLHKDSSYQVCFARRGSRDRTEALKIALEQARENFRKKWGVLATAPIEVVAQPSEANYCLQAVDYFLWALQRVYAKAEDRYLRFLWQKVGVIHDVDDRRERPVGVYYSHDNVLTADKLKKEPGI